MIKEHEHHTLYLMFRYQERMLIRSRKNLRIYLRLAALIVLIKLISMFFIESGMLSISLTFSVAVSIWFCIKADRYYCYRKDNYDVYYREARRMGVIR